MLRDTARGLWAEPRVPNPPRSGQWDYALVALVVTAAVLEAALRDGIVWNVVSLVAVIALAPMLLWRRSHPLATVVAAFGTFAVIDVAAHMAGVYWEGLGTAVFVLLLPYSLGRWAAGRDAVVGLAVVAVPVVLSTFHPVPLIEVISGSLIVPFVAAVGAAVRYQDTASSRRVEKVKLLERAELARELHDTVAHHVSAIAIRAQAGRVVAATDPGAALDALLVIEEEASRTLAEMRSMVGSLRHGEEPELAPTRGVADIELLTTRTGDRPQVAVEFSGNLRGLRPSVDAALYRLAQESITNSLLHARHATRVYVTVRGEDDYVRLTVDDDGEPGAFDPGSSSGYGLIGMAERAKLLGGTLKAGPNDNLGWTVDAVLPTRGGGS